MEWAQYQQRRVFGNQRLIFSNKDIILQKADKGNSVVSVNTADYTKTMKELLGTFM